VMKLKSVSLHNLQKSFLNRLSLVSFHSFVFRLVFCPFGRLLSKHCLLHPEYETNRSNLLLVLNPFYLSFKILISVSKIPCHKLLPVVSSAIICIFMFSAGTPKRSITLSSISRIICETVPLLRQSLCQTWMVV